MQGGLEVVPARSHKPKYVGSSPTPATIKLIPLDKLVKSSDLGSEVSEFESRKGY